YETILTPYSKDGGYDVVAQKIEKGQKTRILIDAKHYHGKVDLKLARQIGGVVLFEGASKGVIVTMGKITRDARKQEQKDSRIELIDRREFCSLMNEHCGRNWVRRIDQLISESKIAMQRKQTSAAEEL